jgi:CRISPR-associated protein Cmr2
MSQTLHFTVSPVQAWVATARRLRDFWSGSYLLSYLSGIAMLEVDTKGGKIKIPHVPSDELYTALKAIRDKKPVAEPPTIGSLPNRFEATFDDNFDVSEVAKAAANAFRAKWRAIAQAVWDEFIAKHAHHGEGVQARFFDQIDNFWEISWVVTEEKSVLEREKGVLERRKTWRSHLPPIQSGDHCTLIHEWSELSGFMRSQQLKKQDDFWTLLREDVSSLNLGEAERLCAIALVKRLYPLLPKDKQQEIIGWSTRDLIKNWASTSYMAAVPFIEKALKKAPDEAAALVKTIHAYRGVFDGYRSEYTTRLPRLEIGADKQHLRDFTYLDGHFFLLTDADNTASLPFKENSAPNDRKKAQRVVAEALKALHEKTGQTASPYYALLLMDGDSMGKLLAITEETRGKQEESRGITEGISELLGRFAGSVNSIVSSYSGQTVYAGGDDVLAVLPLDTALVAAEDLRLQYIEVFKKQRQEDPSSGTISAALVFVHHSVGLKNAMRYAHHQLDEVAKDGNGRDSIALSAINGNGQIWSYVSTWDYKPVFGREIANSTLEVSVIKCINRVVGAFEGKEFGSKFFYKIHERLEIYSGLGASSDELELLLVSEYEKSRDGDAPGDKETIRTRKETIRTRMAELLSLCRSHNNKTSGQGSLNAEAAIMVRFLGAKGVTR